METQSTPPTIVIQQNSEPRPDIPRNVASNAIREARYHPTPSLDPRNVEAIDGFEEFKGYLSPAQTAFSTAHENLIAIDKAAQAAEKNGAWNPSAKLLNVAVFAEKKREQMTRAFDGAVRDLSAAAKALDSQLSAPMEAAAGGALAQEIRAHVRSLPPEGRVKFLGEALERGDAKSLAAVCGAPHYLTGVAEPMVTHYTRAWREKSAPEATRRLAATRAAIELLETRGHLVWDQTEKAMRGKFVTVNALRKANTEAEKALLMSEAS